MTKIHKLSSNLSNQIAAGEVIERPASVVKELVENALDAGATRIRISFIDAGLKAITVQDNGTGIAADQIDLAFTRHATSKIATEHDLFNVASLGFRGEALASIAAVSHVQIKTNTGGVNGVQAEFAAGVKKSQLPAASKKGTEITVKELFYNTPARLKYLRSPRTEIMRIVDIVSRLSLGHPQVSFTLTNQNKQLLKTSGNGNLQQVVANIYGRHLAEKTLKLTTSDPDFEIAGLISKPELTRSSRNFITLLLNGRYIRNFQLNKAIMAGYGNKLGPRHYPLVVLAIKVDPLLVDVNVHPTKQEVRLSKEKELGRLITKAISDQLLAEQQPLDAFSSLNSQKQVDLVDQLEFNLNPHLRDTSRQKAEPTKKEVVKAELAEPKSKYVSLNQVRADQFYVLTASWDQNVVKQQQLPAFPELKTDQQILTSVNDKKLPALTLLGRLDACLLAKSQHDLYLINVVAARRRLAFDQIKDDLQKPAYQESLLTPLVFDFNQLDFDELQQAAAEFKQLGLTFEAFGEHSLILRSAPTWLKGDLSQLVRQILDLYLNTHPKNWQAFLTQLAQFLARTLAKQSAAVSDNQLLSRLSLASDPYYDADGQIVLVRLSQTDLNKMFKKER